MPVVYDFRCRNAECPKLGFPFESLLRRWDSPDPACPSCGQTLERQFPAPRLGWVAKPWVEYDLKETHREAGCYDSEGMWVTRRRSTSRPDGEPERVLIQSRQEMKRYCEEEGCYNPEDLPPHLEIDKDGKQLKWAGHSGQWV